MPRVTQPLLDDATLDTLRRLIDAPELEALIRRAMETYRSCCDSMAAPGASADDIHRHAHKVKGSSGTLGLHAISTLAEQIEALSSEQRPVAALLACLRRAVASTHAELVGRGLLPAIA
jgi:HPt (histidine-containing phosphotransfer) domain-containing protein